MQAGGLNRCSIPFKEFFFIVLLIIFSFLSNQLFIFIPFAYGVYLMFRETKTNAMCLLFFILPFATVFKFDPAGISLFTVWEAVFILKILFSNKGELFFDRKVLMSLVAYFIYLLIISLGRGVNGIVSVIGLLLPTLVMVLGTFPNNRSGYDGLGYSFAIGTALSNLCGLLANVAIPRMKQFAVHVLDQKTIEMIDEGDLDVKRFYGLFGDPNILAIYTICSMGIIMYLFLKGKMSFTKSIIFMAALMITGFLTVSKTFMMLTFVMFVCFLFTALTGRTNKNIKRIFSYIGVFLIIVCIASIFIDLNVIVDRYTYRLSQTVTAGENVSLSKLTTGRTDIWALYFKSLSESFKLLTGYGLGGGLTLKLASHNTFIQMLYIHGLIGTVLYIAFMYNWRTSISQNTVGFTLPKNRYTWIFILLLIVNLCSLDVYTWDYYYYMIGIAITLSQGDSDESAVNYI